MDVYLSTTIKNYLETIPIELTDENVAGFNFENMQAWWFLISYQCGSSFVLGKEPAKSKES